jgi:hypothetical protein
MDKNFTIFTVPKPFIGEFDLIQRNAIESWIHLISKPQIILVGNDFGVVETAKEYNLLHIPNVSCAESGASYLDEAFNRAQEVSKNDIIMYTNCDIIFLNSLTKVIECIDNYFKNNYLIIGRRVDISINKILDFSKPNLENELISLSKSHGILHGISGLDYFVFRRLAWMDIPKFIVGRPGWDNWLAGKAVEKGHFVVDATNDILAIHQNHSFNHIPGGSEEAKKGQEAKWNRNLREIGIKVTGTTKDATWEINNYIIRKKNV